MTTLENAARQALETLETISVDVKTTPNAYEAQRQAIAALSQALEQPADELYCWKVEGVTSEFTGYYAEEEAKATATRIGGTCQAFPLYVRPQPALQAAIEQQPVAWLTEAAWGTDVSLEKPDFGKSEWKAPEPKVTPLYTEPPKRKWVGLTDEEIAQGNTESWVTIRAWQSAVWWADERLKEKNT